MEIIKRLLQAIHSKEYRTYRDIYFKQGINIMGHSQLDQAA